MIVISRATSSNRGGHAGQSSSSGTHQASMQAFNAAKSAVSALADNVKAFVDSISPDERRQEFSNLMHLYRGALAVVRAYIELEVVELIREKTQILDKDKARIEKELPLNLRELLDCTYWPAIQAQRGRAAAVLPLAEKCERRLPDSSLSFYKALSSAQLLTYVDEFHRVEAFTRGAFRSILDALKPVGINHLI